MQSRFHDFQVANGFLPGAIEKEFMPIGVMQRSHESASPHVVL